MHQGGQQESDPPEKTPLIAGRHPVLAAIRVRKDAGAVHGNALHHVQRESGFVDGVSPSAQFGHNVLQAEDGESFNLPGKRLSFLQRYFRGGKAGRPS